MNALGFALGLVGGYFISFSGDDWWDLCLRIIGALLIYGAGLTVSLP